MKQRNIKIFLFLALTTVVVGVIAIFIFPKKKELYCATPIHDFGRIPEKENEVKGFHKFRIENNTKEDILVEKVGITCSCVEIEPLEVIKPGKENFLTFSMTLSPEQTYNRKVDIILVPKKKEIPELQLTVIGRAELKPSFSQEFLSLGKVIHGKTKTAKIIANFPSEDTSPATIKEIQVQHKDLQVKEIKKIFMKSRISDDDSVNITQVHLSVDLVPSAGSFFGQTSSSIKIAWHNNETISLPVSWTHARQNPLDRDKVILYDVQPEKEKIFQITYDKDVAGNLKEHTLTGDGLSLSEVFEEESYMQFSLRYFPPKEILGKNIGFFALKTENGKEYILPIEKE